MSLEEGIISIVCDYVKYPLPWSINDGDLRVINLRDIYFKRWRAIQKKGDFDILSVKSENSNCL